MYRPQYRTFKMRLNAAEVETLIIFLEGEIASIQDTKEELAEDPMVKDETMLLALADGYDEASNTLQNVLTRVKRLKEKFKS